MIVEMFSLFFSFLVNAFNNLYLNTFYCATVNASVRTLAFVGRSCKISVCCLSRVCLFEVDYIRWRVWSLKFQISFRIMRKKVDAYCRRNYVDLYRRDSRSLDAAVKQKRNSADKVKNRDLKFYELKYSCIHGGRNYKGRGKGIRDSSTFQMKCPCSISLRLSEDGNQLVVTQLNLSHENHDVGKENVWLEYGLGGPPSTLNI